MLKVEDKKQLLLDVEKRVDSRIDTRVPKHIRVINGTLDEDPASPSGVVLVGRIDPATFRFFETGDYQRSLGDRKDIFQALKDGAIPPPVDIGVRGEDFRSEGEDFIIKSPAYIIDGWQRIGTAQRLLDLIPQHNIRLFGVFHFNTDAIWERKRFDALNKNIVKVSANLHLRNLRDGNPAVLTLFGLSQNQKDFPLFKKICWSQNMQRGEIVSAILVSRVIRQLHRHYVALSNSSADGIAGALNIVASQISLPRLRENVVTFFRLVDECWPLAHIEMRQKATAIKQAFLMALADVLAMHVDFWDDAQRRLMVDADNRHKLAKFPINDPHIRALAASGGTSMRLLYQLMVDHLNSGRRINRLVERTDYKPRNGHAR